MKRVNRRRSRGWRSRSAILVALVAGATVLAGCQSDNVSATSGTQGSKSDSDGGDGDSTPVVPTTPPALVAFSPANGAAKVRLDKAIKIKVSQGTLAAVKVTTKKGKTIPGTLAADKLSWSSKSKLAPSTKYNVSVEAASTDGKTTTSTSSFKTLTPKSTASAYIQPGDGWVVGVGMPVVVNFSRSVSTKNRDKVEDVLSVKTTTNVEGSWRWMSSQQVQWRPKKYWPANTKVKVTSNLAGIEVQPGVWGTAKRTSDFKVGSQMISTVDVQKHTMTVRRDGKVLRVIPVTTGKPGYASRNGVKVIMSRETSRQMDAATTGTDEGDPEYYNVKVKYAMRLTYSGEFLHQAEWSVASQGRANVSHGCTGMNPTNAKWMFNQSKVGDVVIFTGSKRKLEWGNGYTAWDMPYSNWKNA